MTFLCMLEVKKCAKASKIVSSEEFGGLSAHGRFQRVCSALLRLIELEPTQLQMLLYKFRCALDFQEISFGQWACVSPQKPPRSTVFAAEQRTRQIQRSTSNRKKHRTDFSEISNLQQEKIALFGRRGSSRIQQNGHKRQSQLNGTAECLGMALPTGTGKRSISS